MVTHVPLVTWVECLSNQRAPLTEVVIWGDIEGKQIRDVVDRVEFLMSCHMGVALFCLVCLT